MIPDPVHPALVHFPVVLALLVPLFAALGAVAIARGALPARAWAGVLLLQVLLVASSWAALETGEEEEERVESVVAERHIERHEEAAKRSMLLAALGLPLAAAGLVGGRAGRAARWATLAASVAAAAATGFTGHTGGELVHRYDAPRAYAEDAGGGERPLGALREHADSDKDRDAD